jgi:hypothetical protein
MDIDLHRIHAWSNVDGRVCSSSGDVPWSALLTHDKILIEVASPTFYNRNTAIIANKTKWVIFNSIMIGRISMYLMAKQISDRLLVSPSSLWTLGYPEEVRHAAAGVSGDNHDIRECRCMQFFYGTNPEKWMTLEAFVQSLSSKGKGKR